VIALPLRELVRPMWRTALDSSPAVQRRRCGVGVNLSPGVVARQKQARFLPQRIVGVGIDLVELSEFRASVADRPNIIRRNAAYGAAMSSQYTHIG
jgi:hypothetical protein